MFCAFAPKKHAGSVTAEFAVLMPAVTVVLAIIVAVAHMGIVQLSLDDAARMGARVVARGDQETVLPLVRSIAGPEAEISMTTRDGYVSITVRAPWKGVFSMGTWLSAQAHTALEESEHAL